MHRMIQYIDLCTVHIRLNSVDSLKLVVAKWLGLSAAVRVRVRARAKEGIYISFSYSLKSDRHLCLCLLAWGLV